MRRPDRALWRDAHTVGDLGLLTARWLEGTIDSQPGYEPSCGPDEETAELIGVLAQANRAGFLTATSQPGSGPDIGVDGAWWTQRAAVEGWIAPGLGRGGELTTAAHEAGLLLITHPAHRRPRRGHGAAGGVVVTTRNGIATTVLGRPAAQSEVRFRWKEVARPARQAVLAATQITLAADALGPHQRLWDVLEQWASPLA